MTEGRRVQILGSPEHSSPTSQTRRSPSHGLESTYHPSKRQGHIYLPAPLVADVFLVFWGVIHRRNV
jgi:hypothetical protein